MKLSEILKNIEILKCSNINDPFIMGVKIDSRKVISGDLFVAISGFNIDGNKFVSDAIKKGAKVIVTERDLKLDRVECVMVKDARKALAQIAKVYYGNSDDKLKIIGVTGTNGKTTVSFLIKNILEKMDRKVSSIGTIEHNIAGKKIVAFNTTPESVDLHSFFKTIVDDSGEYVVMEVSSHAISLNRIYGIKYSVAIFTNLTQEHMDFHKNMEDYFIAKSRLFIDGLKHNGIAVINIDDEYGKRLRKIIMDKRSDVNIVTYGFSNNADVCPLEYEMSWQGIYAQIKSPWGDINIKSPMFGRFNVLNIMATLVSVTVLDFDINSLSSVFENVEGAVGRFEKIQSEQSFSVVIDYAHTPDALKKILESARELTKGNLILTFGCGGDRDKTKRPVMGQVAYDIADKIIVTSDNPRTEDPLSIIDDILKCANKPDDAIVEPDRKKAIEMALSFAKQDDCVVVAGKGHETYQQIGDVKYPFDDRAVVLESLKKVYA